MTNICQGRMIYACNKRGFYGVSLPKSDFPTVHQFGYWKCLFRIWTVMNIASYNVNKTND